MIIGCVGSRETTHESREASWVLGRWIVLNGHTIRSGNCTGHDQVFMGGGNSLDESQVVACLPWWNYERAALRPRNEVEVLGMLPNAHRQALIEEASQCHPRWAKLSSADQKLHARNGLILEGVDLLIGWPNHRKVGMGGTGQAYRVAKRRGIETIDLTTYKQADFVALCERLRAKE